MHFKTQSRILIITLLALLQYTAYAQVDQSLENLRNPIPPSPNASALIRYSEWPVSLYTGVPEISIPIYELKGRNISLPVSLSYHASGNRVGDIASWVGLGFSLNAGGLISRTVRGLPDEDTYFTYANGYSNPNDFTSTEVVTGNYERQRVDAANQNGDSQQDIYTLSAMGRSYRLLLKADGSVTTMPYSNLKIIYTMADSWTVIMEDGTKLLFGGGSNFTESNNNTRYGNNVGGIAYNSSWYLKSITSPNGEVVNFTYTIATITQDTHITQSDAIQYNTGGSGSCSTITNFPVTTHAENQLVTALSLASIESDLTKVTFIPVATGRSDLNGGVALSEIKVYSKLASKYIDDYQFNYTYSQAVNGNEYIITNPGDTIYFHKRLKLLSLKRLAIDNSAYELWSFGYNPQHLPSRRSYAQDHMGFFNGATSNTTLVPPSNYIAPGNPSSGFTPANNHDLGGSRAFNGTYMQAEMLTQITYPTGGYTQFNYEPNSIPISSEQFTNTTLSSSLNITVNTSPFVNSKSSTFSVTKAESVQLILTSSISSGIKADMPSAQTYAQILNSSGTVIGQLAGSGNTYYSLPAAGTYTLKIYTNVGSDEFTSSADNVTINASVNYSQSLGMQTINQMVGGLRVKSVINYDGVSSTPINDRYFSYASGFVISPIDSLNGYLTSQNGTGSCNYTKVTRNASTKYSLGSIQGGAIGYGVVTTLYGPTGGNGKTISYFSNVPDNGLSVSLQFPYPPTDPREWRRGLLLFQADYNATQKIKQVSNSYSFYIKNQVINFAAGYNTFVDPSLCTDTYHYCGITASAFYISSESVQHDTSRETVYNTAGPDSVMTTTNYLYDNAANMQPVRIVKSDSKGQTVTSYNRTALEKGDINSSIPLSAAASTAIDTMLNRNMVGVPIESEKYVNGVIASKLLINYQLNNNHVLAQEVKSQDGSNAIQSRMLLNNYDTYGNLTEQQKTGGPKVSYQWGYVGQYPVAQVTNAPAKDIFYDSFEEGNGNSTAGISKTGNYSHTGAYTKALSNLDAGSYLLTYWLLSGSTWSLQSSTVPVSGTSSTISLSGQIDDVRFYPVNTQMNTYTYDPIVGMTSSTDAKGMTTYYEYDSLRRLINIKDKDGNIVKHTDYHYQGQ
ncbi:hypothetical protein [Mucilaginibacter sp. OK098]|uniref:hypothetical protein n=1 Tax=Mucilaginibacter sp. OK098 TaxID=1855297 RepID=UPI001F239293|nr:hypothetical protein [Mucilaginibacter sp. OK098]